MRRLLKFLHELGSFGLMGALACLLVLNRLSPPPSDLAGYAMMRGAMAEIGKWVFLPSFAFTLIPGLLAIAVNRAFHNAGWAWVKAATGILVFMGGLHALAPIQEEARLSAEALAGRLDPATINGPDVNEQGTFWMLLIISVANIVLAIWRPRLTRLRARRPDPVPQAATAGESAD